uniref:uncharacterized protein LOC120342412 isoform X1 n=1 Tax=Styela clava TaxID=7725 RepID=UPI00193A8370|nr:uncharacterized protein LOC120342412 isoform X1 [Styela clava]
MSQENPRHVTINLHPKHRAVFVHGYGGSSKNAEDQAHTLSTYVYSHSPLDSSKITVVLNKAKTFHDSCAKATNCLLGCIWEIGSRLQRSGSNCDECVELVVFCHSNGAKPVQKALAPDFLTELCNVLDIPQMEIASFMGSIRKKIVVISFGGVCYISDDYAKVVMNFCSTSDNFSKFCHYLKVGDQPKDGETDRKIYVRDPATPSEIKKVPAGILGSIAAVGCISGAGVDLAAKSSGTSDALRHPHYLENILKNRGMIMYIREVLGLSERSN